jgi:hypothetical protein
MNSTLLSRTDAKLPAQCVARYPDRHDSSYCETRTFPERCLLLDRRELVTLASPRSTPMWDSSLAFL